MSIANQQRGIELDITSNVENELLGTVFPVEAIPRGMLLNGGTRLSIDLAIGNSAASLKLYILSSRGGVWGLFDTVAINANSTTHKEWQVGGWAARITVDPDSNTTATLTASSNDEG